MVYGSVALMTGAIISGKIETDKLKTRRVFVDYV